VAQDATSQKEISERTIYVQKGEKTGGGRCYGQEETRPFSDIFSLSPDGRTIFLNILIDSLVPVNFVGEYSCDREV